MRLAFSKPVLDHPSLVLNRSWVAIHVTTVRRALCLVYSDAALVVETEHLQTFDFDGWCDWNRSTTGRWVQTPGFRVAAPEVIQLQCYNKVPAYDAPFTRRNLFERDAFTCQYCGKHVGGERMSIDHVTPRSKGGKTNWQNCVLACVRCNSAKGDRTLREAGLRLLNEPRPPRWTPYLNIKHSEQLESWAKFTASHRAAKG
ncbi:MAG: HNH endonuclease [Planctomycetes bacterium]|nr:HNH endonuclease [Planctomycetota bacterium]